MNERIVNVRTSDGNYRVVVGTGVLGSIATATADALGHAPARVFIVADAGVPESAHAAVIDSFAALGASVHVHVVRPSERDKSIETLEGILAAMARTRHERADPVVALGGGIVGDTAGFAAACYRRGVPIVQCPTTLLAMVDASVGGKTAVNLAVPGADGAPELRKNFVGAFHQPILVVADIAMLSTLSDRHFRCGLAECVKHGMIAAEAGDDQLGPWTARTLDAAIARDAATLIELIARNVALKATIVGRDTRETDPAGGRVLLNLGHTFAHAIEPIHHLTPDGDAAHAPLHHGEAVSLGLAAAAHCATTLGHCDASIEFQALETLVAAGLPTKVCDLPDTAWIVDAMLHDKKVSGDKLRLVLPIGPARARLFNDPLIDAVRGAIDSIRA
ncbi:MAG: 3-dehydroquinate synthase [Planctomycetes bacterium]|nr:3-dehydroquinate synthase [Planctomycetota bacterium]